MSNPFAVCAACGDTGVNSQGDPCYPCRANARLGARRYAALDSGRRLIAGPTYDVNRLRNLTPPTDTAYIVLLGDKPKPIARWKNGRWQRKKKTKP